MNKLAALAVLAACGGGAEDEGGEVEAERAGFAEQIEASGELRDPAVAKDARELIQPSIDAVEFCEELAAAKEIRDELVDLEFSDTKGEDMRGTVARSVRYTVSDNEGDWAGTITCKYEELKTQAGRHSISSPAMQRLMAFVRGHVTGIKILEYQLGNPDNEHQTFFDTTLQDPLGAPLLGKHNRELPGTDGILDYRGSGCMGSEAQGSIPGDRFFERDQERYANRMKWLRGRLRDANFRRNAQRR